MYLVAACVSLIEILWLIQHVWLFLSMLNGDIKSALWWCNVYSPNALLLLMPILFLGLFHGSHWLTEVVSIAWHSLPPTVFSFLSSLLLLFVYTLCSSQTNRINSVTSRPCPSSGPCSISLSLHMDYLLLQLYTVLKVKFHFCFLHEVTHHSPPVSEAQASLQETAPGWNRWQKTCYY